jgi:hypothetical protein
MQAVYKSYLKGSTLCFASGRTEGCSIVEKDDLKSF